MADINTPDMGKKVFFLHPSAFVQNTIIEPLVQQEYEIYLVKSEEKILKILKKYPNSIVFACIDEVLSPKQWETWVGQIRGTQATKDIGVGILSNTNNDELRQFYLDTCKVSCGFIPVKQDKDKSIKTLLETLQVAEAKGRRKYVRTDTRGDTQTTINFSLKDTFITGEILDISVVGLSCSFSQDVELKKNTLLHDIQIKLQSVLLKVEGIVYGSREERGVTTYVILFSTKTDFAIKTKIRTFMQKRLQAIMDAEMQ
jgi:hypothetical protein